MRTARLPTVSRCISIPCPRGWVGTHPPEATCFWGVPTPRHAYLLNIPTLRHTHPLAVPTPCTYCPDRTTLGHTYQLYIPTWIYPPLGYTHACTYPLKILNPWTYPSPDIPTPQRDMVPEIPIPRKDMGPEIPPVKTLLTLTWVNVYWTLAVRTVI